MATLVVLFLMMLLFFWLTGLAGRRARREAARREAEMEEERRSGDGGDGIDPFEGMPFGGLLGHMLGGAGGWSRSYTYDAETGRWVEISGQQPADPEEDQAEAERTPNGAQSKPRRAARRRTAGDSLMGQLGMLGGGGAGSADFDVQPPD